MKKAISIMLALALCLSCAAFAQASDPRPSPTLDNFTPRHSYAGGLFTDVNESAWYGTGGQAVIKTVYELGIMNGMGGGVFSPEENIRISEAVKMAAVVHSIYNGGDGAFDMTGSPWYKNCVDYAVLFDIIAEDDFSDYGAYATRAQLAYIFENALPESELPAVNTVNSIADVSTGTLTGVQYADEVLTLYRAGVLTGDEGSRRFRPNDNITRAESAAVIARAAVALSRQRFEILSENGDVSAHPDYAIYNESGESITLGYQPSAAISNFFETQPISSQTWQHKNDTKLISDVFTGASDVRYLISDKAGTGVYVFALAVTGENYKLQNGLRCGSAENALITAYKPGELVYEDHSRSTGGYWGDADSTYTYYPGDASPWCSIAFDIIDGAIIEIRLGCSIY